MSKKVRRYRRLHCYEELEARSLLASIPVLHSHPEATNKIYLDFDGQTVISPNLEFDYIHAPPYDLDGVPYDNQGQPSFNEEEVAAMLTIWERMAEDFRPFDVDVTTVDPFVDDPTLFEQDRGIRVLFTTRFDEGRGGTGAQWFQRGSLGFASLGAWRHDFDSPAWVFSTDAVTAGEIGSHEVGHAIGLTHDGDSAATGFRREYRGPHGSGETAWSPIMGFGTGLTHWDKGEYPGATNPQHDFGHVAFDLGIRPDDYATIAPLVEPGDSAVHREGIIETQGDVDTFSFEITTPGTLVDIQVQPWHNGPNLDIGISLLSLSGGRIFHSSDPIVNPVDRLSSQFQLPLDPGTYYLLVDGVGKAPVEGDPGYSDYGSLGYYKITGTLGGAAHTPGDINGDNTLDASDIDALYASIQQPDSADLGTSDLNRDEKIDRQDVDLLVREVLLTEYGDLNLDGSVDFADFIRLSTHYGQSDAGWMQGDLTGDDDVDFADFVLLSASFGFTNQEQ